MKFRKRFDEKVITLVNVGVPNLWDVVLKACDVCGKKSGRRNKGDTWGWNEEVKESVSRKKDAHKAICQNNIEENKRRYKSMRGKAVLKAMRVKVE